MFEGMRRGGWSIQAQFLLYSSALLIPALIFSGLMIVRSASLERAAMEGDIDDVVRAVTTDIDRELAALDRWRSEGVLQSGHGRTGG